jgi:hypothetical protein
VLAQAVREGRITPAQSEAFAAAHGGETPTDDHVASLKTVLATFAAETVPLKARGSGGDAPDNQDDETKATASVKDEFEVEVDGKTYAASDSSATVHARALAILKEQGKEPSDAEAYIAACEQASKALATS